MASAKASLEMIRPSTAAKSPSYHTLPTTPLSRPDTAARTSPKAQGPGQSIIRHQRFVLSDPVAFSYLEEDASTVVLDRNRELEGYQLYVVEQWACARTHPTFIVTAFTGDSTHTIKVGILSVPADEESWSPRLRVYFKALSQYYARRKETPLGALMVTNLSTFPSSLTIVLVPGGNPRKHREDFFVSEDLKRLGCSGRVGLSIAPPSLPTQAKFHQLYRVSDRIDFYSSVIELVKLCQVALLLFGCLGPEYADGLLCDVTERAANDWWLRIGTDLYNVEPTDGVLGQMTVAGLLGTLIGARNRLSVYGAPISKDVFDLESTKRAIAYFQKSQRLHRSRRLDRTTLDKLHQATAKQASGSGSWNVPKALKSTVADLSGKGGEMVMEMVGKADKTSIADVETVDIDRFAQFVNGERARWLWHGKSHKRTTRDLFADKPLTKKVGLHRRQQISNGSKDDVDDTDPELPPEEQRHPTVLPHRDEDSSRPSIDMGPLYATESRPKAFHRATGLLRDAVGMRGHDRTRPKDSNSIYSKEGRSGDSDETPSNDPFSPTSALNSSFNSVEQLYNVPEEAKSPGPMPQFSTDLMETPTEAHGDHNMYHSSSHPHLLAPFDYPDSGTDTAGTDTGGVDYAAPETNSVERSASARKRSPVPSLSHELDEHLPFSEGDRRSHHIGRHLRRTQSSTTVEHVMQPVSRPAEFWPRQLSFSLAEESLYRKSPIDSGTSDVTHLHTSPKGALRREFLAAETARQLRAQIAALDRDVAHWVARRMEDVEELEGTCLQDLDQLNSLYYARREEYQALQEGSREIVAEERSRLAEGVRDVETLGAKLEYEISALRGKVEDVEDAVEEFERRVAYTEGRIGDLVDGNRVGAGREGWLAWVMSSVFGKQGQGGRAESEAGVAVVGKEQNVKT